MNAGSPTVVKELERHDVEVIQVDFSESHRFAIAGLHCATLELVRDRTTSARGARGSEAGSRAPCPAGSRARAATAGGGRPRDRARGRGPRRPGIPARPALDPPGGDGLPLSPAAPRVGAMGVWIAIAQKRTRDMCGDPQAAFGTGSGDVAVALRGRREPLRALEAEVRRHLRLAVALVDDVDAVVLAVQPAMPSTIDVHRPTPSCSFASSRSKTRSPRAPRSRRPPLLHAVQEDLERPLHVGREADEGCPARPIAHLHRMPVEP